MPEHEYSEVISILGNQNRVITLDPIIDIPVSRTAAQSVDLDAALSSVEGASDYGAPSDILVQQKEHGQLLEALWTQKQGT